MASRGRLVFAGAVLLVAGLAAWAARAAAVATTPVVAPQITTPAPAGVGALARLLPRHGVRRISGPSEMVLVLSDLLVEVGDRVKAQQVIARLDDYPAKLGLVGRLESVVAAERANIQRLRSTLASAQLEAGRTTELFQQGILPPSERDRAAAAVDVAQAALQGALAQLAVVEADLAQSRITLERRTIRAPIAGQVLRVHARAGEKVGADGILDLGETHAMYAVAEVWESDVARVHVGQAARISSPVLKEPLTGHVERIALAIGKKRMFDDDPGSARDSRVVEVEIRLADSAAAAAFTNLQVSVLFAP